ncbi:hypothetical protein GALMADRAFT_245173 [Galerina marginata CBS 339.88]|uniref:AAA+ ATPase domain-containing protein n=1 Tax=Galerina marginata (strain CBS 339.88) TaxID=685588 RepID=A0A067T4T7_GALM3|nr:hypothetical protein GALMADRAFT_245173 [Galerina marginata CBS 339.88]
MQVQGHWQQPRASKSGVENSWFSPSNSMSRIMGFSFLASLFQSFTGTAGGGGLVNGVPGGQNSYVADSIRLFLLGTIIEVGRRFFGWVVEKFKLFQYSITAQFSEGDPAYEWIILLLTEEEIWKRSRQFRVSSTSSLRQWTVNLVSNDKTKTKTDKYVDEHAEYVPTYEEPQLFRWKGYWAEVRRGWGNSRGMGGMAAMNFNGGPGQVAGRLFLTLYTRDMGALSAIVEEARQRYVKTSRPHVIVHTADQPAFGPGSTWTNAKRKSRRPLSSIILQEGVIKSLVDDAHEFFKMEDWYVKAGIPHRRGYLLHGPPGTGKSSTIYAVAGELGLEIYSLSLASGFVDDAFLARAVSSIPKQAIFLVEDIDCAFPSREELDDEDASGFGAMARGHLPHMGMVVPGRAGMKQRSSVTLSGLLNVLDGVGSEEGKIFFATTNYIDRLDPALLRPGRIDKKILYKLATKAQAAALFLRFYPEAYTTLLREKEATSSDPEKKPASLTSSEKESSLLALSDQFATSVPEHEFSTAELQGFLLGHKQEPELAVAGVTAWIEEERTERTERAKREQERKDKQKEKKESRENRQLQGGLARLGMNVGGPGGGSVSPGMGVGMGLPPPGTVGGPVGPSFVGGGPVVGGPNGFNAPVIGGPVIPPPNGFSTPGQPPVAAPMPVGVAAGEAFISSSASVTPSVDGILASVIPAPKPLVNGIHGTDDDAAPDS